MEFLTQLWMPIVVSAVLVFVASSIIWMATPLHKKDYGDPPDQEGILDVLRRTPFAPGMYYLPWSKDCKDAAKDPQFKEKFARGPWVMMIVPTGAPSFGKSLGLWALNCLVLSAMVAYVASAAVTMGIGAPHYLRVFRVVGAVALLAHAGMAAHDTMWKGLGWRHTVVKLIDGTVYALLTAGTFGWLWPRE